MSILLSLTNSIYPIYTRPLHFGQIFPNLVYCIRNRTKGIRQFIEIDRELLAAPAGLAAEPGGDYRRRLLLGDRWRARENHRQLQRTVIARIVERHREV